jgi:DNA repair protein RadC
MRQLKREAFIALILDVDYYTLGIDVLSSGSAEETSFKPSDLFRSAIALDGNYILAFHNHPNERAVFPSKGDVDLTKSISNMCDIMKIHLLDHIIIGLRDYYSFMSHGSVVTRSRKYFSKVARGSRRASIRKGSTSRTGNPDRLSMGPHSC